MHKLLHITGILLFLSLTVWSQQTKKATFDVADFNNKASVAEWLCQYDQVAWRTSDFVMKQKPSEEKFENKL